MGSTKGMPVHDRDDTTWTTMSEMMDGGTVSSVLHVTDDVVVIRMGDGGCVQIRAVDDGPLEVINVSDSDTP